MTDKEIMLMCKRLSYKYPQVSMRDDLMSEGTLAIYERLDKHPEDYPASLYNIAREAMSDYVNLKTRPTSIPVNPTTRAVANGFSIPKDSTYSQAGIDAIRNSLQPTVEFDDEYTAPIESGSKEYEDNDLIQKGLALLTKRERDVIESRYYDNKTQEELAVVYKVSRQAISLWEDKALYKMKKA